MKKFILVMGLGTMSAFGAMLSDSDLAEAFPTRQALVSNPNVVPVHFTSYTNPSPENVKLRLTFSVHQGAAQVAVATDQGGLINCEKGVIYPDKPAVCEINALPLGQQGFVQAGMQLRLGNTPSVNPILEYKVEVIGPGKPAQTAIDILYEGRALVKDPDIGNMFPFGNSNYEPESFSILLD